MSSLSAKDRVSLCSFTFSDGRRCLAPRTGNNPRFCFYHAQKEARARAAQKLGKDLAYFFSGDYLSACDLSTALARLIPAVVRGDVKPKTAHTVAYLAQTLMQSIHLSKHEYINAFGTDGWREAVRNSVNGNQDYLFPPAPTMGAGAPAPAQPDSPQPQPLAVAHPFRGEVFPSTGTTSPAPPPTQAQQPQAQLRASAPPSNPPQPAAQPTPSPVAHPFRGEASSSDPPPKATAPQPIEIAANCPSERSALSALRENLRSEEPAFSSSPVQSPTSAHAPQTPAAHTAPSHPACHPERSAPSALRMGLRSEGSHPVPTPHSPRRQRQPLNPTAHRGPAHPLRNLPQIGTPTRSTSTTTAASA